MAGLLLLAWLPLLLIALLGVLFYQQWLSQSQQAEYTYARRSSTLLTNHIDTLISHHTTAVQLLASEPLLVDYLARLTPPSSPLAHTQLARYCDIVGASYCYLLNTQGTVVADNQPPERSVVGNNFRFRAYFQQALQGHPEVMPALGTTTNQRGVFFSAPVYYRDRIIGVAVIKFLADIIDEHFRYNPNQIALVDSDSIIFSATNPDWYFRSLFPLSTEQRLRIQTLRKYGELLPDSLNLTLIDDDTVHNSQHQVLRLYQQHVPSLPGWSIVFLANQHNTLSITGLLERMGRWAYLFPLLLLCTSLASGLLYYRLKKAIDQREQDRRQIQSSEDRLRRFATLSSEAILIHDKGKGIDANLQAQQLLGYTLAEVAHLNAADVIAPEYRADVLQRISQGDITPYESVAVTKTGERLPVLITARNMLWQGRELRVASFRDLREQYQTQARLDASEQRFQQLSNLVADGVLILKDGLIIEANHACYALSGHLQRTLQGQPLDFLFKEDAHQVQQCLTTPCQDAIEVALIHAQGHPIPVEIITDSISYADGDYQVISIRDISHHKAQEARIRYQANYDALTELPNRVLSRDRIEQAIRHHSSTDKRMVLFFIDLDDFKKVNDNLGHDVGDQLLIAAARRLANCLNEQATLARHGGDEFLVFLEQADSLDAVEALVRKMLHAFTSPFVIGHRELVISTSIGLSVYPDDAKDYQALMRTADIAMYQAKAAGKNTFHFYTESMHQQVVRQLSLENSLRCALDNNELSLVFQPLFSGQNERLIMGAECLLRWHSPTLGAVSPSEFIPLAEQSGLIVTIGQWVLEQACRQAAQWTLYQPAFTLSVNVSPRQFRASGFTEQLLNTLQRTGLSPRRLVLEVTEGLLIEADSDVHQTLLELTNAGVCLSMDDFGTGYSSLSYLKNFPFGNLKIDRSFINELPNSIDSDILVNATIAMAHEMELTITAEGIETQAQLDYLKQRQCNYLQGYLLSHPVDIATFTTLLQASVAADPGV